MKVSLGMKLRSGPWGGGNQFGHALVDHLRDKGIEVSFDLKDPELDIILLTDPRRRSLSAAYNYREIINYLLRKNWKAIVVHRVNECDERKGTTDVNQVLIHANLCADHTVFVSTWLKDLYLRQDISSKSYSVILNGSDRAVFHPEGYRRWNGKERMRLVTHHWGGNWMKGFDVYQRLDKLLATEPYQDKISFTYIGNLPKGFQFYNATYVEPKYGEDLAAAIRQHHVYLTASKNEPGSNHQNEGANCGLPLLYRESGCLPEYCDGFGISFTAENFERKLQEMMDTYDHWVARMKDYPHTAERTSEAYYDMFVKLLERRDEGLKRRKWWRRPIWLLQTWAGR